MNAPIDSANGSRSETEQRPKCLTLPAVCEYHLHNLREDRRPVALLRLEGRQTHCDNSSPRLW